MAIKVVPHEGDLGEKVEIVRESLLSSSIQHPQIVSSPARGKTPHAPLSSHCSKSLVEGLVSSTMMGHSCLHDCQEQGIIWADRRSIVGK